MDKRSVQRIELRDSTKPCKCICAQRKERCGQADDRIHGYTGAGMALKPALPPPLARKGSEHLGSVVFPGAVQGPALIGPEALRSAQPPVLTEGTALGHPSALLHWALHVLPHTLLVESRSIRILLPLTHFKQKMKEQRYCGSSLLGGNGRK